MVAAGGIGAGRQSTVRAWCYARGVTRPSLSRPAGPSMTAVRRDMAEIPEEVWDGLLAQTPGATPFSRRA